MTVMINVDCFSYLQVLAKRIIVMLTITLIIPTPPLASSLFIHPMGQLNEVRRVTSRLLVHDTPSFIASFIRFLCSCVRSRPDRPLARRFAAAEIRVRVFARSVERHLTESPRKAAGMPGARRCCGGGPIGATAPPAVRATKRDGMPGVGLCSLGHADGSGEQRKEREKSARRDAFGMTSASRSPARARNVLVSNRYSYLFELPAGRLTLYFLLICCVCVLRVFWRVSRHLGTRPRRTKTE